MSWPASPSTGPLPNEKPEAKAPGAQCSQPAMPEAVSAAQVGLDMERKLLISFCAGLGFSLCSVGLGLGDAET